MDPTRWKRRNDVLQSMLDLSADRREVFRREACAEDEALERDVRSLLEADRQAAGFLERPAMDVDARALANAVSCSKHPIFWRDGQSRITGSSRNWAAAGWE